MAARSRLCYLCGSTFADDETRRAHMTSDHPGERVAWRGKDPWAIAADGSESRIAPSAVKRMRRNAGGPTSSPPPGPPAAVTRDPDGDDDAGPVVIDQSPRPRPAFAPAPDTTEARPTLLGPTAGQAIREAMPLSMLADMLRQLSVTLSEVDGAGEAGYLTQIESTTIATLLYDATVGAVERYFGGDVNRFRLGLAVAILALGKGRIHARAILSRRTSAAGQRRAVAEVDALAAEAAPDLAEEVDPNDPVAVLAARQRAWAASGAAA